MVQKTITVVEEGYILDVPVWQPWIDAWFDIPVELPPNTKINWAKLNVKFHSEIKTWYGAPTNGSLSAHLNENLVFDYYWLWDCNKKEDFFDVTPYIMPLTGGTEGAKATNRLRLRGSPATIYDWAKFHFPIELTIDYSGEEPTGEGVLTSEEPTPTTETLLMGLLAKPESVILVAVIGIFLVVLIGIWSLVRR